MYEDAHACFRCMRMTSTIATSASMHDTTAWRADARANATEGTAPSQCGVSVEEHDTRVQIRATSVKGSTPALARLGAGRGTDLWNGGRAAFMAACMSKASRASSMVRSSADADHMA